MVIWKSCRIDQKNEYFENSENSTYKKDVGQYTYICEI